MAKYGVIFSGGLDSTVLLYDLVHKYGKDEVVAIGVDFGQKTIDTDTLGNSFANNIIERQLMTSVTGRLGVKLHMVDLSTLDFVLPFMQKRIQQHGGRRNGKSLSLFPGRNMILAFIAGAVAETYGCEEVCMGFPKTDYIGGLGSYSSSKEFLDDLNNLVDKTADMTVKFTAPLNHLTKAGEVLLGQKLGVNFLTDVWTCLHPKTISVVEADAAGGKIYSNKTVQCGVCKPCIRNRAAFLMAEVTDPFTYASFDFKVDYRMYTQFKLAGDNVKILEDRGLVLDEDYKF